MKISVKKIFEMITEMFESEKETGDNVAILLQEAKNDIRNIRSSIDQVNDEAVLEMYIYRLRTAEAQYRHLLKMAKDNTKHKKIG